MPSGIFTVITRLFGRLFWRPLQLIHAKEGLDALRLAEGVFNSSQGFGGMYLYPWFIGREQVDSKRLLEDLENLGQRSRNRKLKKDLNEIIKCLNVIWVNAVQGPSVAFESSIFIDPAQRQIDNGKTARQQDAYDKGLLLVTLARKRVTKLETRVDLA
jgi:hypothetical protein